MRLPERRVALVSERRPGTDQGLVGAHCFGSPSPVYTVGLHDALELVKVNLARPIHVAYTDMKPLLEKLRHTNLWQQDAPKIQFALSAYVHAYPNNVVSVWVYIASLHSLRG